MLKILLLLAPLVLGAIVALANSNAVAQGLEKLVSWMMLKYGEYHQRTGKIAKYFLTPSLSSLLAVAKWTEPVRHKGLRSGIRVAAYLYIVALILLVAAVALYVAFVVALVILAVWLVLWLIGKFLGESKEEPNSVRVPREQTPLESMYFFITPEKQKMENLFHEQALEIGEDGTIYKPPKGVNTREKIGFIDDEGTVYDTREFGIRSRIGRIDQDGNVRE